MCDAPVEVIGAGRTDAGVHAKAMVANAWMETDRSPDEIRDYMNRYLPDDICADEVKEAAERFHARYRAVGKTIATPATWARRSRSSTADM
jgi:tRNA pseudouridine38-40 synthase